jgi:hypothetical protein
MNLIGSWSNPLPLEPEGIIKQYQQTIEKFDCCCQFCGTKTLLSTKVPLGFFDVCLKDNSLPNEPVNWTVLCVMCSDLNSLNKLKGKGSFIEAAWIQQGKLTNLLRLAYAITLKPEGNWGNLKKAAPAFLNNVDNIPDLWIEINWDGSVEQIIEAVSRLVHPLDQKSYINHLRFRFDMEPYKDAILYWAVALETDAINFGNS